MIRSMSRLDWRQPLLERLCILALVVTAVADQKSVTQPSSTSRLASKLVGRATSLWNKLFPECYSPAPDEYLDKGKVLTVAKKRPRFNGKLGYRQTPEFTRVDCEGGLSILLDPKGPEGKIQALGSDVNLSDSGDVLRLHGQHGRSVYDVVISGKKLVSQINKVNLYDACSLSGDGLKQSSWYLNSNTTGNVVLKGMFDDCTIVQKRENLLDMYWLGSNRVDIYSKSGVMRLSGSVEHSRLRVSGDSQVLLNQLRTKRGWVSASGKAYVEIFGASKWSAFSADRAQILADGVPVLSTDTSSGFSVFAIDD